MEYAKFETKKIFSIANMEDFVQTAIEVFNFQYKNCAFYRQFCKSRNIDNKEITDLNAIPFLPIQFFKTKRIIVDNALPEVQFGSSGTTGQEKSLHLLADTSVYIESLSKCFIHFFGMIENLTILALLPSYLERNDSSLVFMVRELMKQAGQKGEDFYLENHSQLAARILDLERQGKEYLLIGVSFALLDFASNFPQKLRHCRVVETGGMKGRSKEMVRDELHKLLKNKLGVMHIYSEYGMTELLSQAYTNAMGHFSCPAWMKVFTRDVNDPYTNVAYEFTGGINIIDLANVYSCSFIETEDLGRLHADGSFDVLGRIDKSIVRGCNLLSL